MNDRYELERWARDDARQRGATDGERGGGLGRYQYLTPALREAYEAGFRKGWDRTHYSTGAITKEAQHE